MASRRRRLGAHADGGGPGARAQRRPRSAAAHHGDARRGVPRPRQAGHDRGHRRPHPLARSRAGRSRADRCGCSIGSTCTRSTASTCARRCVGLVAHHLKPGMFHKAGNVGDGAFRRLAQKVDLELLARLARADCLGRTGAFDCSAMDWFIERARRWACSTPPAPLLLGRHVLALGVPPGPRVGEIAESGLRASARWRDHDRRRRDRRRAIPLESFVEFSGILSPASRAPPCPREGLSPSDSSFRASSTSMNSFGPSERTPGPSGGHQLPAGRSSSCPPIRLPARFPTVQTSIS